MTFRPILAAALVALLAATATPRADACSPPLPGVNSSVPVTGATYPANAALFLFGYGQFSLTDVTVTVDGQPASLVKAATSFGIGLAATVEPAPQPGQVVQIQGTFCDPASNCPPYALTYTAGPADTVAPAATKLVTVNVHDYVDYKSGGGDCTTDSDLAYWIEVEPPPLEVGASPVIYSIEAYRDASFTDLAFRIASFTSSVTHPVIARRVLVSQLGGKSAPEAFCFRVTTLDASGNAGPASAETFCKPCHLRVGGEPTTEFGEPPQPTWTAADIFPGGPCDTGEPGTGGSGGDGGAGTDGFDKSETIGGCGCRVGAERGDDGADAGMLGGLIALIGGLVRVGRRRRR